MVDYNLRKDLPNGLLSSRETLKHLASIDISYLPSGLGTDADKVSRSREEQEALWAETINLVHSAASLE